MKDQTQAVKNYLAAFDIYEQNLNGGKKSGIHGFRKDAIKRFSEVGFPGHKDEAWRFTDLSEMLLNKFSQSERNPIKHETRLVITNNLFADWKGIQLVFVDGFYREEFSQLPVLPKGVTIQTFAQTDSGGAFFHLLKDTDTNKNEAFSLLNNAFLHDGVLIHLATNTTLELPVHILSVQSEFAESSFQMIKNLFHLEQSSSLSLIETHVSVHDNLCFTNSSTHIHMLENSSLDYYKLQNESKSGYHISNLTVEQKQDSKFRSHAIDFGGSLVRNNLSVHLNEMGAEATLNGLYLGSNDQHIDNSTSIEHAAPNCNSYELYQGILDDKSHGVFSGMIHVHPDAQKTDAKQSNNCLLLSDEAKIDAKPQLEIYADDVKCTHGATVGQLNEEEIFYLRSRGIHKEKARQILTYAFAEKIIENINIKPFKEKIELIFQDKLGKKIQL